MAELFLRIVNMSISASWIVLAVLLLRVLLKKAPKWIMVLLWGIVAVRLICPFSVESVLSLIPSAETISPDIMMDKTPSVNSGVPFINNAVNPVIGESFSPNPGDSANPLQIWIPVVASLWIIGIIFLLAYTIISCRRLNKKVETAVLLRDNIYLSENVSYPFVLGVVKPKIYLPFNMNEQDMKQVITHEQAHIRRKDHWWKPFGFLILILHWFNPLVWLGYMLMCRDIEIACDEKAIEGLDSQQRADYSQALLTCSANRHAIAACPLAFGEVGVKERVKSVLNYKKPALWLIIIAVIISVAATVCFLTNPAKEAELFSIGKGYTNHDKVDVEAAELMIGDNSGHIIIKWDNQTGKEISFGEEFHIYRKVLGIKFECRNNNDGWDSVLNSFVGVEAERAISLNGIEISAAGNYVLEFDFKVAGDNKEYTAYIEFKGEMENE